MLSTHSSPTPTRQSTSRLTRAASSATLAAALVLGFAGAASASPIPSPDSCLTMDHDVGWTTQTVRGTNNCSQTRGFYVVSYLGPSYEQSPCLRVAPGKTAGWKWNRGRTFRYTGSC